MTNLPCSACECQGFAGVGEARFCSDCGHAREEHGTIVCPDCGEPVEAGFRFCGDCGASLAAGPHASLTEPEPLAAQASGQTDDKSKSYLAAWHRLSGRKKVMVSAIAVLIGLFAASMLAGVAQDLGGQNGGFTDSEVSDLATVLYRQMAFENGAADEISRTECHYHGELLNTLQDAATGLPLGSWSALKAAPGAIWDCTTGDGGSGLAPAQSCVTLDNWGEDIAIALSWAGEGGAEDGIGGSTDPSDFDSGCADLSSEYNIRVSG